MKLTTDYALRSNALLTLQPEREKRHRVILLANLVDTEFELEHVYHAARLSRTNASWVAQVYLDALSSMNFPC